MFPLLIFFIISSLNSFINVSSKRKIKIGKKKDKYTFEVHVLIKTDRIKPNKQDIYLIYRIHLFAISIEQIRMLS